MKRTILKMRRTLMLAATLLVIVVPGVLAQSERATIVSIEYEGKEVLPAESPATLVMSRDEFVLESDVITLEADRLVVGGSELIRVKRFEVDSERVELTNHRTFGSVAPSAGNVTGLRFELIANWFRPLAVEIRTESNVPNAGTAVAVAPGSLTIVDGTNVAIWRYRSDRRAHTILELPPNWRRVEGTTSFEVADTDIMVHIVELPERPHGQGDAYVSSIDILEDGTYSNWSVVSSDGKSNMGEYTYAPTLIASPDETRMLAYNEIRPNGAFPLLIYAEADGASGRELINVVWNGPEISYAQ